MQSSSFYCQASNKLSFKSSWSVSRQHNRNVKFGFKFEGAQEKPFSQRWVFWSWVLNISWQPCTDAPLRQTCKAIIGKQVRFQDFTWHKPLRRRAPLQSCEDRLTACWQMLLQNVMYHVEKTSSGYSTWFWHTGVSKKTLWACSQDAKYKISETNVFKQKQ